MKNLIPGGYKFMISGILDKITKFVTENTLVVAFIGTHPFCNIS